MITKFLQTEYPSIVSKEMGKHTFFCCPLHDEKTPSLSVDDSKDIYHCFGCGAGGHLVNLVSKTKNLSRSQAISYLNEKYGTNYNSVQNIYDDLYMMLDKVNDADVSFLSFFASRGITEYGDIRIVTKSQEKYASLLSKGYDEQVVNNVMSNLKDGGIFYPLYDYANNISSFMLRFLEGSSESKFLAMPGTGTYPFGLNTIGGGVLTIVEGANDCLAVKKYYPNTIAMNGLKLDSLNVEMLKRRDVRALIFWLDDDTAGRNFVDKIVKEFDMFDGLDVLITFADGGDDPNDYVYKNNDVKPIYNAKSLIKYVLDRKLDDSMSADIKREIAYGIVGKTSKQRHKIREYLYNYHNIGDDTGMLVSVEHELVLLAFVLFGNYNVTDTNYFVVYKKIHEEFIKHNDILILKNKFPKTIEKVSAVVLADYNIENIEEHLKLLMFKRNVIDIKYKMDDVNNINELNSIIGNVMVYSNKTVSFTKYIENELINDLISPNLISNFGGDLIDEYAQGFLSKRLYTLIGATGHGKTTLAINWLHKALENGVKCVLFNGEMTVTELSTRMLGIIHGRDIKEHIKEKKQLPEIPSYIDNLHISSNMRADNILGEIRQMSSQGYKLFCIDYIQLVDFQDRRNSEHFLLRDMTKNLKLLCMELDITVFFLSQQNIASTKDKEMSGVYISGSKGMLNDVDGAFIIRQNKRGDDQYGANGTHSLKIEKLRYGAGDIYINLKMNDISLTVKETTSE